MSNIGCALCSAKGVAPDGAALAILVLWKSGYQLDEIIRALCFTHRRNYQNVIGDVKVLG